MDIITEDMLMEAPPAPADATMNETGTGTPIETERPSEGQETPKNGKAIIFLHSGARIEMATPHPEADAVTLSIAAKDGDWAAFRDAALYAADGTEIMRLTCADLTDAVMVGWKA